MFDRIKKIFSGANRETKSFDFGAPAAEFFGNVWNSFLTRKSYLDEYKGWVFRCIQLNAQEVASVKLHLRKKKSDEEVFENPILQLIYKPNPFITFSDLTENYQASLEMDGNAFWYLAKDKLGRTIREIWPLRPDRVTVIISKEEYIAGYSYRPDGKSKAIFFKPDEILHFKTYNPINSVRGIGTVEAAIAAIDSDNYARLWNKKFFENSARPDVVLEYDGTMDEDSYKRTTEKWEQKYKGVENAGKTAVLRGGLKIKHLNFSQKEMDFVELRKFSRDEIFALFGIHKGVLFADDVNLANAQIALWSYARLTIKPRIRKLVEYLNEFLLPRLGYGDLYFTFDDPVPQDRDKQLSEYTQGWGKWLTTNDIRTREGLPEIDGGSELLVPFSLLPMSQAKQIAGDDNEKQIKSISEQREKEGEIVWKAMIQRTTLYENKFKTGLQKIFVKEMNKVLDKLEGKKAIKSVDDYLPDDYSVSATIDLARPLLAALVKQEGEEAAKLLMLRTGIEQVFDFNKAIQDILERDIKKFAEKVGQTTRDSLKDTLSEGIKNGEGADDLKKRVFQVYGAQEGETREAGLKRAEAIARTETIRSSNFATEESWKQSGVVEGKEWYTAEDERVCDFCNPMNGKTIGIDDNYFDKGDSAFGFKVDWSDVSAPPLHPQCVLPDSIIYSPDAEKLMRFNYSGEAIKFNFADGTNLSVTPNHILLTTRGFIVAKNLRKGDKVINSPLFKRIISGYPNIDNSPTSIENIFGSFLKSSGMSIGSVPMASENFHGDGRGGNGNIDIISTNGLLRDAVKTQSFEPIVQFLFNSADAKIFSFPGDSNLETMLIALALAGDGLMSSEDISHIFSNRSLAHHQTVSLRAPANYNTRLVKAANNNLSADVQSLSDFILRYPSFVATKDIIDIEVFMHKGFVYDISSLSTLYIVNGIISSNCRCTLLPVLVEGKSFNKKVDTKI